MKLRYAVAVAVTLLTAGHSAHAYEFSEVTQQRCPACTTPQGQQNAAELAEGLSINGTESPTFGSTESLAASAEATSPQAAQGVAEVAFNLLKQHWKVVAQRSPLGFTGVVVETFSTGYVIGTEGRALFLSIFGGDGDSSGSGTAGDDGTFGWSNARWKLCLNGPCQAAPFFVNQAGADVIPDGDVYVQWDDERWGPETNLAAPPAGHWTGCPWQTPYPGPCEYRWVMGWGPQSAGAFPGATPVTITGVGVESRPGTVWTESLAALLAQSKQKIVDSDGVEGPIWETLDPAQPPSAAELLHLLDTVIADNPDFGDWIQTQISGHPQVEPCAGLTVTACQAQMPGGATVVVQNGDPADPDAVVVTQTPDAGSPIDGATTVTVHTEPWTATPPSPFPPQYADDADDVAQQLKNNNSDWTETYTDQEIKVVARTCVWIAKHLGPARSGDCSSTTILVTAGFSPLEVALPSTLEATRHDVRALSQHPVWFRLNYERAATKPGREWRRSVEPCKSNVQAESGEDCDEFPFFSTEQGGPLASQGPLGLEPSLELVATEDNRAQGRFLSTFYSASACNLTTGSPSTGTNSSGGSPFLIVPINDANVPSGWFCNAHSG